MLAGAALVNGQPSFAVFAAILLAGYGAFLAFSGTEFAVAQSRRADERQRKVASEAASVSAYVLITVAPCGYIWEVATGRAPGAYTLMCAVGGLQHMGALVVLSRRR